MTVGRWTGSSSSAGHPVGTGLPSPAEPGCQGQCSCWRRGHHLQTLTATRHWQTHHQASPRKTKRPGFGSGSYARQQLSAFRIASRDESALRSRHTRQVSPAGPSNCKFVSGPAFRTTTAARHARTLGNGHVDRVGIVVGEPLPRVVLRNDPIHGVYPGALRNGDVVDGQQTWDAVR